MKLLYILPESKITIDEVLMQVPSDYSRNVALEAAAAVLGVDISEVEIDQEVELPRRIEGLSEYRPYVG